MIFSGRKRRFDRKKHRAILIVALVAFMGLSLGTALAASGSEGAIIFTLNALGPEKVGVVKEVFGQMGAR